MNWRDIEAELIRLFAGYGAEVDTFNGSTTIVCAGVPDGEHE
jgi:hypothetical protein